MVTRLEISHTRPLTATEVRNYNINRGLNKGDTRPNVLHECWLQPLLKVNYLHYIGRQRFFLCRCFFFWQEINQTQISHNAQQHKQKGNPTHINNFTTSQSESLREAWCTPSHKWQSESEEDCREINGRLSVYSAVPVSWKFTSLKWIIHLSFACLF